MRWMQSSLFVALAPLLSLAQWQMDMDQILFASPAPPPAWVGPTQLILHLPMNDNAANTTVSDISGGGNSVTAQRNTSLLTTNGMLSTALYFNGTSDYMLTGINMPWTGTSFKYSIAMWVKFDSAGGTPAWTLWSYGKKTGGQSPLGGFSDGTWVCFYEGGVGGFCGIQPGSFRMTNWTHYVWTSNGTTSKIYTNGVYGAQANQAHANMLSDLLCLGAWYYNSTPSTVYYFKGAMDDVRVWNRCLSDAEILSVYQAASESN